MRALYHTLARRKTLTDESDAHLSPPKTARRHPRLAAHTPHSPNANARRRLSSPTEDTRMPESPVRRRTIDIESPNVARLTNQRRVENNISTVITVVVMHPSNPGAALSVEKRITTKGK